MSISSVGSTPAQPSYSVQNSFQQRSDDYKALQSALQSGDIAAAKSAFATFSSDIQKSKNAPTAAGSSTSSDLKNLEGALNSGDISAAQQAFAAFQSDAKSAHKAHHKHHSESATSNQSATSSTGATSSSTVGTLLNQAV